MADLSNYYSQFTAAGPGNYGIQTPAPPVPPRPHTEGGGFFSPGHGMFGFTDDESKRKPMGGREYWKGNALLNAYNWLLPYTGQTVARGADIFGDIARRESSRSKAYELSQFQDYAPLFAQAVLNADPRQAAMLDLYNKTLSGNVGQAQSYVDRLRGGLDNPMSSAAARDITQASLGQSALKGFGPNSRDAALAYIKTGLVGEDLQRQRESQYQNAMSLLGQTTSALSGGVQANKSVLGDPFMAFAGRPSQPMGSNPMSPDYSGFNNDLFSYSATMDALRKNMAASHTAGNQAMIGQLVGGLLGAAGGVAGGI